MSDIDLANYKSLYLKTAREHMSDLKKNLLQLNQNPADQQLIYEVFRLFHSLKSQNFFMGFEKSALFCKILEFHFRKIKDGETQYQPTISNTILEALNNLESSLVSIEQQNKEVDLSTYINSLENNLAKP